MGRGESAVRAQSRLRNLYGTLAVQISTSFIIGFSRYHTSSYTMIKQRLSRTLHVLSRQQLQCLRVRRSPLSTSSPSIRTFTPSASQRIYQQRWYSQAPEAAAKKEEASGTPASEEQKPAQEQQQEDPVQKELETKKREVIDLTVCHHYGYSIV